MKPSFSCVLCMLLCASLVCGRWSEEKVAAWASTQPWRVGANYISSTAINQLEMWNADTFDLSTIELELGWAQDVLGFNSMRVFLHHLAWEVDPTGFLERVDNFLSIAEEKGIGILFVLLDGCWDPWPQPGTQRAPFPYVHNSGWVQDPGLLIMRNMSLWEPSLKPYVTSVISAFANDSRVWGWDLFNEPDNPNQPSYQTYNPTNREQLALGLLELMFKWARAAGASQPLTSGLWWNDWDDPSPLARAQLLQSDVLSFHNYDNLEGIQSRVASLLNWAGTRPIFCTEYMARPEGSTFNPIMGYLKGQGIGAHNWGFVYGKTQTIMPWDSWCTTYTAEPAVWFHDIFRQDGTAFNSSEIEYIVNLTSDI